MAILEKVYFVTNIVKYEKYRGSGDIIKKSNTRP
jgi:hypothetical protein